MNQTSTSVKAFLFGLLGCFFYANAFSQVNSLPFNEAFGVGYSSDFYTSAGTSNAGSTDACTLGNYVGVITSSTYMTTKTYSVPQGDGLQISFELKNGGTFTAPDVYIRVNNATSFSSFSTSDNDWVKIGSASSSSCNTNTFNVGSDIVGGQRVSVTINFSNASSTNWISIDNLSLTAVSGSSVQTTYTEDFTTNAWYNSSGYAKIPYHSNSSASSSYAYLFNGGVGGFSDYYAALSPGFDPNNTNIITEEVNTSGYSKGELRFSFLSQYPCGGPNSYTYDEDYSFFTTNVYIMQGADNGSNSWVQLPVNYYFPDDTWRYAAVDISGYKNANIKIRFSEESECSSPYEGIDNIQILDRDCSISNLTCGTITGSSSPSANTNYNYSVPATTGAGYYLWIVRKGGTLYQTTPYIVSGQGTQNVTVNFGSLTGARLICIPYDANPATNTNACYATLGYLDMTSCTPPVISSVDTTGPSTCGGTDGSIKLLGLTASTTYAVTYNYNSTPVSSASFTTDGTGALSITGLAAGSYNNFVVSLSGCSSAAYPSSGAIVLSNPANAQLGTPAFSLGSTSSRCIGAATVTYTATATNNTGITYSLDVTSLNAGNTINAGTGAVTYTAGYSGTAVITATATGCGGPLTATHTVTISPSVITPVFSLGSTSSRCIGAATVTYTATATNNTGITYSLDVTSLNAGNTINAASGAVIYTAGYSGTAVITATATGCSGPLSAIHTVTISPNVTTPVFTLGSTSTRCIGADTVNYTATSTNSTGITYSLDVTSLNAGNTVNAGTGTVTYTAGYSGTAVITASAAGCGGPLTATHTVTITANTATPVFSLGSTSNRCMGAGTVTYTASAGNSTNITYSLDATSLNAGNTINAGTGAVIYTSAYSGTAVITATATGCGNSATATHTVTIAPAVGIPVFGGGASRCQGVATVTYTATASNSTGITYALDANSISAGNSIVSGTGAVTWAGSYSGTATITATAAGCNGPTSNDLNVTVTPTVSAPVFSLGSTSTRCEGVATVTYTATATNNTGITYSLDAASLLAGNTINASTGAVTYTSIYTGTALITASAAGCNGPVTTTHTVTISAATGSPVFNIGSTTSRCQGAGTVAYTATASNSTGISYSLDATSLGAGNTIDANTGNVTWTGGYYGTATITATASGCGNPTTATLSVTINPPVAAPVFSDGSTALRCEGAATTAYQATADNSTGITYSLDATATLAGNSINSATGAVTWAANYTGTATVTATAAGCGGPITSTIAITVTAATGTPVFALGNSSGRCQGAATITYTATAANSTGITYSLDATSLAAGNTINSSTGAVTYTSGYTGTAVITALASGCGTATTATHIVTITIPVGTPAFNAGSNASRCQGAGTVNYAATASHSSGITYSLDVLSLAGGNIIDSTTGNVTWSGSYTGTTTVTASAAGCGGPTVATLSVIVSPPTGTPVFVMGSTSSRCQGAGTVTYSANATNSTGITYSLDVPSEAAGNTINPATGQVTWVAGYSGTATITASAAGCGNPSTATHTVTVNASVGTPVFTTGSSSSARCSGSDATVNYSVSATNNTGITYHLDTASLSAGNTIDTVTGIAHWIAGFNGTAIITATATGCNGPVSSSLSVLFSAPVTTPVFNMGSASSRCQAAGAVTYTATSTNNVAILYRLDVVSTAAGNVIDSTTGTVTWVAGYSGTATITAIALGCGNPYAYHTVTIGPSVGTPVFLMGPTSTRCIGAGSLTYTATATDSTGLTYSLDATSLNAGNTINAVTGMVNWTSNYSGTAIITATATGCNGPVTATHTVTITNNTVGVPVFGQSDSTARCSGAATVTYTATATNSASVSYALDPASLLAGNTIDASTGAINWVSGYTGRAVITATATGCNGPTIAMFIINTSNSLTPVIHISANPGNTICSGDPVTFSASIANGGNSPAYQWMKNSSPVGTDISFYTDNNLNQGDAITCMLTSDAACVSPASITSPGLAMIVHQRPSAPILSVNSPLCAGDNLQLDCQQVSNAGYSWVGPDGFISAIQNPIINNVSAANSGTYSASVTVNGCASVSDSVHVVVKPTPNTPSISQSLNTLTSSPAATYQWYLGNSAINGATLQSYTVSQAGLYSVEVTDTNGCHAKSLQFNVKVTGVEEIADRPGFDVYPNPVSASNWLLTVQDNLLGGNVAVYDASGRLVYSSVIHDLHSEIPAGIAPGIYLLEVIMNDQRVGVRKLIKL